MTPFETSCMPLLKKVGTHGKNNGIPLCQEFHMNQSLHDLKEQGFRCWYGGYGPNAKDNGFECH